MFLVFEGVSGIDYARHSLLADKDSFSTMFGEV
jgi:hypothetical protein